MGALFVLDLSDPTLVKRVVELRRASYAIEANLIGFADIPPLVETPEEVARLDLTVLDPTVLGSLEHGDLVGVVGYRRQRDIVDIDRLAVHPSSLRRGIARSLIAEVHKREADAVRFEVSTDSP